MNASHPVTTSLSEKEQGLDTIPEEKPLIIVNETPKTTKLKGSERTKLIEDFKTGTIHPDYEIIATKVAGKYIVKPRKQKLTDEQVKKVNPPKSPVISEKPAKLEPTLEIPKTKEEKESKKKATKVKQ
jgi:hypothetical protein